MPSLDWTIPIGTLTLVVLQFVGGLVGIMRAFGAIERSIDGRFNAIALMLNTFKEGDLRELRDRVGRIEQGQNEWTQTLRDRTHQHANEINQLKLHVDRLNRPGAYGRRADDSDEMVK